jgi:hypothetical protein
VAGPFSFGARSEAHLILFGGNRRYLGCRFDPLTIARGRLVGASTLSSSNAKHP